MSDAAPPLERLKTEAERWVAALGDSTPITCRAAKELRDIVQRAHDLGFARSAEVPSLTLPDARTDPKELSEAMTLAMRWRGVYTDESYGPQGKCMGTMARALIGVYGDLMMATEPAKQTVSATLPSLEKAASLIRDAQPIYAEDKPLWHAWCLDARAWLHAYDNATADSSAKHKPWCDLKRPEWAGECTCDGSDDIRELP